MVSIDTICFYDDDDFKPHAKKYLHNGAIVPDKTCYYNGYSLNSYKLKTFENISDYRARKKEKKIKYIKYMKYHIQLHEKFYRNDVLIY